MVLARSLECVVAASLLLVACSSGDGATDVVAGAETQSSVGEFRIDAGSEFDLVYGNLTTPDPGLVDYAVRQEQALDAALLVCLANEGVDFEPRTAEQIRGELEIAQPELTRERREIIGYGISIVDESVLGSPADVESSEAGVPEGVFREGGCWEQARLIRSQIEEIAQQFFGEFFDLFEKYESHPDVVEAQAAWAECMARQGFEASTSMELQEQIRASLGSGDLDPLQDFERRAAVADFDCESETGVAADAVIDDFLKQFREKAFVPFVEQVEKLSEFEAPEIRAPTSSDE